MEYNTERLLNSDCPYITYNAERIFNNKNIDELKAKMEEDQKIVSLIDELADWPGPQIGSHKSAKQFFHKLAFLSDIGVTNATKGINVIIKRILSTFDDDCVPCLHTLIPKAYGGSGETESAWALCDAPNTLYALVKMQVKDKRIDRAVHYLSEKIDDFGFSCHVSESLGRWRGPGKKTDPCPYATLVMLKVLIVYGKGFEKEIDICSSVLLDLWEHSTTKHPYIFYMGTDFRKLKPPFIWYDLMHVVDVLSQVPKKRNDSRLLDMYHVIKKKETNEGYIPESIYMPWKEWDFGQKKTASDWLTLCVLQIENRLTAGNSGIPDTNTGGSPHVLNHEVKIIGEVNPRRFIH